MVDKYKLLYWSNIKNVIRNISIVTYIVYIFAYAYDWVVSYTVFKYAETNFVVREASDELVQFFLHGSIPYTFIGQFIVGISLPCIFYYWFKRKGDVKILYPLLFSLFFLMFMATLHLRGGCSWWI